MDEEDIAWELGCVYDKDRPTQEITSHKCFIASQTLQTHTHNTIKCAQVSSWVEIRNVLSPKYVSYARVSVFPHKFLSPNSTFYL